MHTIQQANQNAKIVMIIKLKKEENNVSYHQSGLHTVLKFNNAAALK